ncbi:hypothetical protein H312_03092 [Anncaliia algerae PRA339]|uniref:Uncharacterized protein n=1 Tax=Anncaliia algerae PRA339 TaxID=1288291 RepID=A0A059EXQ5_9MICR|nr:hypothetical protein H312_03092 [Anncaliia algerae PRA339]
MNNLGGSSTIVQIDETMINYKCKSYRDRSPLNKTDALCNVDSLTKLPKLMQQRYLIKKSSTIIPSIKKMVYP